MDINKWLGQPQATWGHPGAILVSFGSRVKGCFLAQGTGPGCGNTNKRQPFCFEKDPLFHLIEGPVLFQRNSIF